MVKRFEQMMLSELVKELIDELKRGDRFVGFEDKDSYTSSFNIKLTEGGDLIFEI